MTKKILFATNTSRHAWNHRSQLAKAAVQAGYKVYFLCPNGEETSKLTTGGIEHISLDLSRKGLNPLKELLSLIKVYRVIKKLKPDIYHGFTIKLLIYGGISCRFLNINKYFLNITGIGSLFLNPSAKYNFARKIVSRLYKVAFATERATAIFQNNDDRDFFIKNNWLNKSQTIVFPGTGIDCKKITPSYSTRNEKVNVFFAG